MIGCSIALIVWTGGLSWFDHRNKKSIATDDASANSELGKV